MSNPSNPNSPNPPLFDSNRPDNQTKSVPKRIQCLLSTSQSNSTSSALSTSPYSNDKSSRCEGLDLLTMAVLEIDGDKAFDFDGNSVDNEESKREDKAGLKVERRRRRQKAAMPSKFQDSVLQPWKRRTRRSRDEKVEI